MGWFWDWATTAGEEPPESVIEYCKKIWMFLGYGFAHICIGAANIMILAYSLKTKDLHAFACAIGWQFFVSEAILVICYTYCNPVYKIHRRVVHMFLNILGLIFICSGCVLVLYIAGFKHTVQSLHGLLGFIAFICTIVVSLMGPFAAMKYDWPKAAHGLVAWPTYIIAAICLITGILGKRFKDYVGAINTVYLILIFAIFYVVFIVAVAITKTGCTWRRVFKPQRSNGQQTYT